MAATMDGSYRKQAICPITRKWGFLAGVCTSPVFILFAYLGDPARGRAAWISAGIVFVIIRAFWGLRKRLWFWTTVTMIAFLHVPLILFIPWGNQPLSYVALLPVGLSDFGASYGIIRLMEKVIERNGVAGSRT